MSTQTEKMVDVAMATIEAAETEEAIGGMGDGTARDPELQVGGATECWRHQVGEAIKLSGSLIPGSVFGCPCPRYRG